MKQSTEHKQNFSLSSKFSLKKIIQTLTEQIKKLKIAKIPFVQIVIYLCWNLVSGGKFASTIIIVTIWSEVDVGAEFAETLFLCT
jgi:hypothetical protein